MIADKELVAFLNGEAGDEKLAFVCRGTVYMWVPGGRHIQGLFMRDELSDLLVGYLVRQGRVYESIEQASAFYDAI